MSDGTIHSISLFNLKRSISTPCFLTLAILDLMLRLWMDSSRVQRMVLSVQECVDISKEMEIYKMASGTFSFDMVIQDKKTKMPCKLVHFVSNFNVSSSFVSNFKFKCCFLCFSYLLQMLGGHSMAQEYPIYKILPFKFLANHIACWHASTTRVCLKKHTPTRTIR